MSFVSKNKEKEEKIKPEEKKEQISAVDVAESEYASITSNKVGKIIRNISWPSIPIVLRNTLVSILASVSICGLMCLYQMGLRWLIGLM